jgi:uncharacterized protein (DUF488 family)
MKILNACVYWELYGNTKYKTCNAEIIIPGVGNVTIKDFLSEDLRNRIEQEAIFNLKQKLVMKDSEEK